jgi:gluconate 2-dehydrogenase gamma chain
MGSTDEESGSVRGTAVSRRDFGKAIGLAGAAHALPATNALAAPAAADVPPTKMPPQVAPTGESSARAYTFFTPDEALFVEAAIDRLVPADDLGPGAREADVAIFIDRQLAGTYGTGGKWYMQGPWGDSVREQGYQLPLTPRQLYRLCIAEVDRHLVQQQGKPFSQLPASDRDAVLRSIERGELTIAGVPLTTFFEMLLGNTMEGFFSDPVYGGNHDKA